MCGVLICSRVNFFTLWYTNSSFVSLPQAMYSLFTARPTKFFSFMWPLYMHNCQSENKITSDFVSKFMKYHNLYRNLTCHKKIAHRQVFLYVPQPQCAVSGCRSKFVVRQEFNIRNSFSMPTEHVQWLADVSQVIIMNVMVSRANLQNY